MYLIDGYSGGPNRLISSGPFKGLRRNHYKVLLLDPPWTFVTRSAKGKGRSPERHYHCMTLEEIAALPVGDLLAPNAAVFMWVIDTHIPAALELLKGWGLSYKTVGFYWVKTNRDGSDFVGMGYWSRANPEQLMEAYLDDEDDPQCLLATRGRPIRRDKSVRRLIVAPRREHSRKPDETHARIERLVDGPYLELFARERRPGWSIWGNEIHKFDPLLAELVGYPDVEYLI